MLNHLRQLKTPLHYLSDSDALMLIEQYRTNREALVVKKSPASRKTKSVGESVLKQAKGKRKTTRKASRKTVNPDQYVAALLKGMTNEQREAFLKNALASTTGQ